MVSKTKDLFYEGAGSGRAHIMCFFLHLLCCIYPGTPRGDRKGLLRVRVLQGQPEPAVRNVRI